MQQSRSESKVTHTGNTFVSESGDVERVATNAITDEMTSITASNGVIRQSAKTVTDRAVYDVNEKTSSSSERETRVGVYAGVEAGASTEAGTNTIGIQGKKTEVSKPDASAGFQASHSSTTESSTNKITTAKTSSFTAQNIESDVSGHMELEGTSFTATNRVTLNAGSLTFNEAVDKVENTQNNSNLDIGGKVGVVGTPSAEVNFGIGASASDDSSQQGRGGEIKANSFVVNVTGQMETTGLNIDVNERTTNVGTVKTNNLTNEKNSNNSSVGFNLELSNEGMNMDVNKDGYNSNVKIKDYN